MALPPVFFVDFQTNYAYHATVERHPDSISVYFDIDPKLELPYVLTVDGVEIAVWVNGCPVEAGERRNVTKSLLPGHNEIRIGLQPHSSVERIGVHAVFNPFD